jgi:Skp family chaperone for outer membrane proteins
VTGYSKLDSTVPIDLDGLAGSDLNEVEISLVKAKREKAEEKKKKQKEAKKTHETEEEATKAAEIRAKLAEKKEGEGDKPAENAPAVHKDMKCDVCEKMPIVGVRYHCNK